MTKMEPHVIELAQTSEEAYCLAARGKRHNEFWWYFNGLAAFRGFSTPFADSTGRWWYRVKPGLAYPVDFFTPVDHPPSLAFAKVFLGHQYPVAEAEADSFVRMNVIHDLSGYDLSAVHSNKRRAVRKGMKNLVVEAMDPANPDLAEEARIVWNSHVERTGWNSPMDSDRFRASWAELADWPGTTVLFARDQELRQTLCAWLLVRVIDNVVYVDTVASHTDRLANRPNDTIIFLALWSAARQGVRRAHYALESRLKSLEAFKASLGFETHPFPARLRLRQPVRLLLRLLRPRAYQRLLGNPQWADET